MAHILMLTGSPTSEEMEGLSLLYARGCLAALDMQHDFTCAHVGADGLWRFPRDLSHAARDAAMPMTFAEAATRIADINPDLGLPQMFCPAGVSAYRAVFELLGVPYLGNTPLAMAATADKAMARALVAGSGVSVPQGHILTRGDDLPKVDCPAIVKPAVADNSDGLTLVLGDDDLPGALARAWAHDERAVIERFIPAGRELRCGVIDTPNGLRALRPEEYPVNDTDRPIRTKADKLSKGADGFMALMAKSEGAAWIVDADDPVVPALQAAALTCYAALGCRHYGLFDFRVDAAGTPWFLEAGLYCSFSPDSVICAMARAEGISLPALFDGYVQALVPKTTCAASVEA